MSGIYVHVPFCRQPCHYCNFYFVVSQKQAQRYLAALRREATLQADYLPTRDVDTIYLGGGTPSVLGVSAIGAILAAIRSQFTPARGAELTLEANPDDLSPALLSGLAQLGFNRLSIGIQSFHDRDLTALNRAHSASEGVAAVQRAQAHGFGNLSIDLMFALPGMRLADWAENIERAIALGVPHISCYSLVVEPHTALATQVRRGLVQQASQELRVAHFELLMDRLAAAGYEQYELTNFCKPGYASRHNSSYWQGTPYLGLGPTAHSFNGVSRQWNVRSLQKYVAALEQDSLACEVETLSPTDRINETLMTELRTAQGLNLSALGARFGKQQATRVCVHAAPAITNGWLVIEGDHLRLTREGKLRADAICGELFLDPSVESAAEIH